MSTMLIAFVTICLIIFYSIASAKMRKSVPGPVGVRISVLTRNIVISTAASVCGSAGFTVFDLVFHNQNKGVFLGSFCVNLVFPLGMCATLWFMLRFLASGSRRNLIKSRSTRMVCPSPATANALTTQGTAAWPATTMPNGAT